MIASKKNMDEYYVDGVIAWSPDTLEEYSADPGDYWTLSPADTLKDEAGEPMILVRRVVTYQPVTS